MIDLVQDGTHEQPHDCSKNETGPVVGNVTPVADPELPEDHAELGQVRLRVLVLELQRFATRLWNAQLLDQLLILPAQHVGRPPVKGLQAIQQPREYWQSPVEQH